jgi:transcriptional regulator with XRE-family HTH domain
MTTHESLARQIGCALRFLREAKGARQYVIADLAGMTKAMLSGYETGRQCPSLLSLVKILAALGISWQHFGAALAQTSKVLR